MPCIKVEGGYRIRRSSGGLYPKVYKSKENCESRVDQMEQHKAMNKQSRKTLREQGY